MKNSDRPAFPIFNSEGSVTELESYLVAMQGLLASCAHPRSKGNNLEAYPSLPQEAVEIADELLKQLES